MTYAAENAPIVPSERTFAKQNAAETEPDPVPCKINVGCGEFPMQGYENIDMHVTEGVEHVGDFRTMVFIDADEIVMCHVLEHFSFRETDGILRQMHDWLKPGGKFVVEVPNMEILLKLDTSQSGWQMGVYGAQIHDGEYHKTGFTLEDLMQYVTRNGFVVAQARTFLSENKNRPGYPCIELVCIAG